MSRLTDRQFLKAQIDLEPLGLIMDGPFEAYFCTPKGARIFARSGVDGIHFCFVRGFGGDKLAGHDPYRHLEKTKRRMGECFEKLCKKHC